MQLVEDKEVVVRQLEGVIRRQEEQLRENALSMERLEGERGAVGRAHSRALEELRDLNNSAAHYI